MKKLWIYVLFIIGAKPLLAQDIKWYQPKFISGICQSDSADIFHRLPERLKDSVRNPVWNLSLNTAGEFIHFRTSATTITVRYTLSSPIFEMAHMPSTGVSGLDLYALDENGKWNWAPATFHFGDTCSYLFRNLDPAKESGGNSDFYLYLPLYNSVTWLSIGVNKKDRFVFSERGNKRPVVAYGTSILQGAVASRPGLAWTNIVERNLRTTVINLGFSGNGQLERPIFDLMAKVNAKLYILDCMPNLTKDYGISGDEIKNRIIYGINQLRKRNGKVPILFAEHAVGYVPYYMDTARIHQYHNGSVLMERIFRELKASGVQNIFLLTDKEIGLDINSTTEGLHPNDIGMMKYAMAYEKKIREIFNDAGGN